MDVQFFFSKQIIFWMISLLKIFFLKYPGRGGGAILNIKVMHAKEIFVSEIHLQKYITEIAQKCCRNHTKLPIKKRNIYMQSLFFNLKNISF